MSAYSTPTAPVITVHLNTGITPNNPNYQLLSSTDGVGNPVWFVRNQVNDFSHRFDKEAEAKSFYQWA